MMNRFSESAQEALQRAQQIMVQKQQQQLDVEHIFLALLVERDITVAKIIDKLGGDRQEMARRLDKALSNPQTFGFVQGSATGYIALRATRALQSAAEEADRLKDRMISSEHLLLAISTIRSGTIARILQDSEIDHEKVLTAIRELRGTDPKREEPPDEEERPLLSRPEYEKTIINPSTLPEPKGFNHGILSTGGRFLFLAGQTALAKDGKIVSPGNIVAQYRQVLSNLQAVVEEAGGEMEDIVKMTIFVSDRDNYKAHLKELGKVHKEFFGSYYPAMALLEISRFFDDEAMIEIEGIAVLK